MFGQSETQKRIDENKKKRAAREEGERSDCSDKPDPPTVQNDSDEPAPAAKPRSPPPPAPPMPPIGYESEQLETAKLLEKLKELEEKKALMEKALAKDNKVNLVTGHRLFALKEVPHHLKPQVMPEVSKLNKGFENFNKGKRQGFRKEFEAQGKTFVSNYIRREKLIGEWAWQQHNLKEKNKPYTYRNELSNWGVKQKGEKPKELKVEIVDTGRVSREGGDEDGC